MQDCRNNDIAASRRWLGFRKLEVWQLAHRLALDSYRATEKFPSREQYSLTDQMRRAAVSVSSNLA